MTQSLPSGWSLRPIKHVATCNDEVLSENTSPEREIAYIDIGNVKHGLGVTAFETTTFSSAPSRARRLVRNGDVIASTVRTYLRAIARIENPKEDVVVSTGFAVLRPGSLLISRFFGYAMQCEHLIDEIVAHSTGVSYPAIAASDLVRLKIPFPEVATQNAISDFLDRETAEADALVAKYERLIELLEEKRVALITQAVTKGLDPSVPMKGGETEWLASIPSHWEMIRNRVLFQERDERSVDGTEELLSVSHLTGVTLRSQKNVNMFLAESNVGYKICNEGDLAINTMWAWMGALGISRYTGIVSPSYNVYRIRDRKILDPDYYDFLSRSAPHVTWIGSVSTGVWESRLRLYAQTFFEIRTCVPPLTEQKAIVRFLQDQLTTHEGIVKRVRLAIGLILERRSALITAAVTGQIDIDNYHSEKQPLEVFA